MHITGGKLKGRKLTCCKLKNTRPAMGIVRKSIFDTIGNFIKGANVLDLYAGTGILGIEALSRGATSLTLIDSDRRAADFIRKNLLLCDLKAKVFCAKLPDCLRKYNTRGEKFDLIFLDPPYGNSNFISEVLELIAVKNLLKPEGLILVESEQKRNFLIAEKFQIYKEKKFGNTKITYLFLQ